MSTSEAHSEKAASDEEDFKTNIPFNYDEAPNNALPRTQPSSYESLARSTLESLDECDDDDPNSSFNYSNWDNDDGFMEDSDYAAPPALDASVEQTTSSAYQSAGGAAAAATSATTTAANFFSPANSLSAAAASEDAADLAASAANAAQMYDDGDDDAEQDIKYSPSEMLLRPPTNSMLQYNYTFPPPPSHSRHMQQHPSAYAYANQLPPPPPHAMAHGPGHGYAHHSHQQHPHPHAQQYGPYAAQQHPSGFHPNMWYPNAPYGSSSGAYYRPYGAHRYSHYGGAYPHDPMLDMLQLSNSGREARNRAEKNRRDKLNGSIQELSTMVPHVAESPRRVDKTAVLRFAAHGLRLQYVFAESLSQPRPQLTDSLMKLLDSFFITLTCHGQIVLISSSIEQHLGHCQADLYGQNILHITHPEDHSIMKQHIVPTELETLFDVQPDDDSGEPRPRTLAEEEFIDRQLREDKRSFTVRLARAGPRSEPTIYELVKFEGNFRRSDSAPRGVKSSTFPSSLQLIRRTRGRDDAIPLHTISGNDIVLIAVARIIRLPKVINRVMEANSLEYRTRHLIDGRIIDCDQRIGLVAGYMTDEVRNLSPFTFMHQDDARWVIVALRQMYDCNSSYGESTYRLLTRNGTFIYLQSKGYLEISKETNKVHSFICINTLLEEEEGKRRVQEMKNKFSIIINTKIPQSSVDAPASENPQQLEKAVLCLIQNLQKSPTADDDDDVDSSTESYGSEYASSGFGGPTTSAAAAAAALQHGGASSPPAMHSSMRSAASYASRSTKTPPLALVPPEAASVKTSISKSVSVVNVTAAKHLLNHQRARSPHCTTPEGCEPEEPITSPAACGACICQGSNADYCDYCQRLEGRLADPKLATHDVVVEASACALVGTKRNAEPSTCQDLKLRKRRLKSTEIEHVLTSSLNQLGRSLNEQLSVANELRDQGNKYEVPNSNQRIAEIMEEHQLQSKIYGDIKSEYEVQIQNKSIEANTTNSGTNLATAVAAHEPQIHQQQQQQQQPAQQQRYQQHYANQKMLRAENFDSDDDVAEEQTR